jgi:hypothetical protein
MTTEETATRIRIERLEGEVRDLRQLVTDLEERLVELEKKDRARVPFMGGIPNANRFPTGLDGSDIDHPRGPQI